MSQKHRLSVSGIEDEVEDDLEQRRLSFKLRKNSAVKLSFYDDDLDEPLMLFKKVKQVEVKMTPNSAKQASIQKGKIETDCDSNRFTWKEHSAVVEADENAPVIIESSQLLSESSVDGIPDIVRISRILIASYEDLQLHRLFSKFQENCKFRLFLYAIAFGHIQYWEKDVVMVNVLRRVLVTEPVDAALRAQGIVSKIFNRKSKKVGCEMGLSKYSFRPNQPVVRHCENIVVSKRISKLII